MLTNFLTKPLEGTFFRCGNHTNFHSYPKNDDLHESVLEKNNKNNVKLKESKNMKLAR